MKRRSLACLCVLGAAAMTAAAAPAAQAEQFEFGTCSKVAKGTPGEYADKNCTEEKAGGKYKFSPFSSSQTAHYTGKGKQVRLLSPATGGEVVCKSSTGSLSLTGPKEGEGSVAFSGCALAGEACTTEGGKSGEVTSRIKISLDYTPPKTISVTIEFGKKAAAAMRMKCGGVTINVSGTTDGIETGNVDKMSPKFTDTWEGASNGTSALEAEVNGSGPFPAELHLALAFKGKPKLEVKTHV
jgi:hypothetical protein